MSLSQNDLIAQCHLRDAQILEAKKCEEETGRQVEAMEKKCSEEKEKRLATVEKCSEAELKVSVLTEENQTLKSRLESETSIPTEGPGSISNLPESGNSSNEDALARNSLETDSGYNGSELQTMDLASVRDKQKDDGAEADQIEAYFTNKLSQKRS